MIAHVGDENRLPGAEGVAGRRNVRPVPRLAETLPQVPVDTEIDASLQPDRVPWQSTGTGRIEKIPLFRCLWIA